MKVKELITKLQEYDEELEVIFIEDAEKSYMKISSINKEKLPFDKKREVILLHNLFLKK
jgi:hypothetical protein